MVNHLNLTSVVEPNSLEDVLKALKTIDITRYFAGISREEIAEAVVG